MKTSRDENGIALILVLGILAVLAVLATTFAFNMRLEQKAARNYLDAITADCIARIGVEYAVALLRDDVDPTTGDCEGYDWNGDDWGYLDTSPPGNAIFGAGGGPGGPDDFQDLDNYVPTTSGVGYLGADARWKGVWRQDGVLIGKYAVLVIDESSKININRAGNLSDPNLLPALTDDLHSSNQGWTVAEIDLRTLPGITDARHRNIVQYRYGQNNLPGANSTDDDNDSIPTETATLSDGIDNDGYGGADDAGEGTDEPDEYIPHNPFDDDVEFATIEQIKLVSNIGDATYAGVQNLITAHSADCAQDRYYSSGWHDRININAVKSSFDLYNMIENCGYTAAQAQRYAGNIIDYADVDYVPTVCWKDGTPTPYYGIEGLQINEIMCDTSGIPRQNDATYRSFSGSFTQGAGTDTGINGQVGNWSWPWDNGTYNITIYASTTSGANYDWVLENLEAGHRSGSNSGTVTVNNVQVSGGWVNLRITDIVDAPPPEQTTTFDKIEIDAGDFVEIINISELPIPIDNNWKIRKGDFSTDFIFSTSTAVLLNGHDRVSAPLAFDYLVVANSLYALDYIWGEDDGHWDGDSDGNWDNGKALLCSSMDIANTGEAIALYDNNDDVIDIVHVNTANDDYGTREYTTGGLIDQDESKERPSPINDTADWGDSGTAGSGTYFATPGYDNSNATANASWHVHDGPYANIGLIGDVPEGTGSTVTFDDTDIINLADKLTVVAQRLEAEDVNTIDGNPLPGTWTLQAGAGIDGTDLYEAPNPNGPWDWTWTDDGDPTTGNFRLFDGTYHLFVCADYPDRDFQRPLAIDREVRPSCLAYAGTVAFSGKSLTVTIDGNGTDIPRLDYVLLVPRQDSPGRAGRVNLNTTWVDILDALPGINAAKAQDIYDCIHEPSLPIYRGDDYYEEIGDVLDAGLTETEFAQISNLITVRSDVFKIICLAQTIQDLSTSHDVDDDDLVVLAEKKVEVIVDRSTSPIRILSWKEIAE